MIDECSGGICRQFATATYIQSFSTGGVKMRMDFLRSTFQVSKFKTSFFISASICQPMEHVSLQPSRNIN